MNRECFLKVGGYAGVAFLTLAAAADNLVTYLFGPGVFWILGGTYVAGCWAHEKFCRKDIQP